MHKLWLYQRGRSSTRCRRCGSRLTTAIGWCVGLLAVSFLVVACEYPRVIMSPEPEIHPATDALAAISSKFDQSAAGKAQLRSESCRNAHEWKGALQRYVAAALSRDGDGAQRSATQLYRYMRCVSARDFVAITSSFEQVALTPAVKGDEQIRAAVDEVLAPLVFMFHDMGGRLATPSYRRWLTARRDQLLRAAANPKSFLSTIGMFAGYGDFLRTVPVERALSFVTELGAVSGRCGYFEMAQVNDKFSFCPRDCDLFRNFEVNDGLENTLIGRTINDVCSSYNALFTATSPALRGQVRECVQGYAKALGRSSVAACIAIDASHNRGADGIYGTTFRRRLHVLDDCSVATAPVPAGAKEQRQRAVTEERATVDKSLSELRHIHSELKDHYNRCVDFGHGRACAATLGHALAVIDAQVESLEATKRKSEGTLGRLSAKTHCRADGSACSSQCGIAGQLLRDEELCYAAEEGGQAPVAQARSVHEIPAQVKGKSPLAALATCLQGVFSAASLEAPLCDKSLLCDDGSAPLVVGNACVCGTAKRAKLTRSECATVIRCVDDKSPCTCDGIALSGVYGRASGAPADTVLVSLSP